MPYHWHCFRFIAPCSSVLCSKSRCNEEKSEGDKEVALCFMFMLNVVYVADECFYFSASSLKKRTIVSKVCSLKVTGPCCPSGTVINCFQHSFLLQCSREKLTLAVVPHYRPHHVSPEIEDQPHLKGDGVEQSNHVGIVGRITPDQCCFWRIISLGPCIIHQQHINRTKPVDYGIDSTAGRVMYTHIPFDINCRVVKGIFFYTVCCACQRCQMSS